MKTKGQMSFLVKALFIIIALVLFTFILLYFGSFEKATTEQRAESNLKMEATNVLQKLVNDENCLAYVHNQTPQKGVIDIKKLKSFVSNYSDTEPDCAKALGFDYNIRVTQFEKNFTIYPGKTCKQIETMSDFLCTDYSYGGEFIYVACNYLPSECQAVCQACGEFDGGAYSCNPSWGCGDDPYNLCRYNGSCSQTTCPQTHSNPGRTPPPGGACCIFRLCPRDACEQVISTSVSGAGPYHPVCWLAWGKCDLTKCRPVGDERLAGSFHAHCASGVLEICEPSNETVGVTIPMESLGFGVGLGTSGFSPEKAKAMELEISLPVTIKQNETFSAEGIIYIHVVKGELETLSSQIEDVCEKVKTGTIMDFSKEFHFSFPITYSNGNLCMPNSCKLIKCAHPINFENIGEEGDYMLTFSYNPSTGQIQVRK